MEGCSRALASRGLHEAHRGTDSQVHCNTLRTCCASSGSHTPGAVGQESNKLSTTVPSTHECTAALRPFLPCQTASPAAADLPLPEPSFPRDEKERDGRWEKACGGGRGIYIYVRRQKNRLLGTKRGSKPTEANNSVLGC